MLRILCTYHLRVIVWLFIAMLMAACSTTKFVPEGQYLLNKAHVRCTDDKSISTANMSSYLRQKQNTEIFGFWKLQLQVYSTAPTDTTTKANKRLAENAHKMGEAPVIYDDYLTQISMQQLRQQMNNMGYFHAQVDTQKVFKRKKVDLTYLITANKPYKVRQYEVDVPIEAISTIAQGEGCKIKAGENFSTATLDQERERIATIMRTRGCEIATRTLCTPDG